MKNKREVLEKLNNITNYIKDNPDLDPNAFEMNDLMYDVANLNAKNEADEDIFSIFDQIMSYRMLQLVNDNQGIKAHALMNYFADGIERIEAKEILGDEANRSLFNRLCGVNLYVHQRQRDAAVGEIIYDNSSEFERIKDDLHNDHLGLSTKLFEEIELAFNNRKEESKQKRR